MQETTAPRSSSIRFHELDSLRGLAAVTVVLCHFRLMWTPTLGAAPGWLSLLYPISGGHQAVVLFFVLSGFVLSIPFLTGKAQSYSAFLVRRVTRIYLPILPALALAVAGAAIWHGTTGRNYWSDLTWQRAPDPGLVLQHLLFLGKFDWAQYNTAFWSLVIEMRISILFPFLFLLIRSMKTWMALTLAVICSVASAALILRWDWLLNALWTTEFAAMFIFGILLACHFDAVGEWYRGVKPVWRIGLAASCFVAYDFGHFIMGKLGLGWGPDELLIGLGAVGLLVTAINERVVREFLLLPIPRFLGKISYSLYLIHGTVLFAITRQAENHLAMSVQFVIYLSLSIALGTLFCVCVEMPSIWLGRKLGSMNKAKEQSEAPAEERPFAPSGFSEGV